MPSTRAVIAGALVFGCVAAGVTSAQAIPPPEAPRTAPSASLAPVALGTTLPLGSTLDFVLDDKIDSGSSKPGTVVRMHLKSALVLGATTVAPAGTPGTLAIVATQRAGSGDINGAVQIHLDPLVLPNRAPVLPIRATHEYLNIQLSSGQRATRATTDTVGDIFVPYHVLYHAFRRGRQFVFPVGSVIRAQTAATLDASNPARIVLSTPPPFASTYDAPHADLTPPPFYTPQPARPKPLPKGKPTLPPTAPPDASPAATSPSPAASPTGTPAP